MARKAAKCSKEQHHLCAKKRDRSCGPRRSERTQRSKSCEPRKPDAGVFQHIGYGTHPLREDQIAVVRDGHLILDLYFTLS